MKARNLEKKIGRDRDSDVKKGGIARLREKNKRQGGILRTLLWTLLKASNQAKKIVGNIYRNVREKQGIVVYPQRVLQSVTSLRFVSLVFRAHGLLKIANINPQQ